MINILFLLLASPLRGKLVHIIEIVRHGARNSLNHFEKEP